MVATGYGTRIPFKLLATQTISFFCVYFCIQTYTFVKTGYKAKF